MFADILRKNHSILTDRMDYKLYNYDSKLNETSKNYLYLK